MKIVVTGTEGYLGALLAPTLLETGHSVLGIDTGYYKQGWLYNGVPASVETLAKDIRHVTVEDLAGADAVVHMAELSNDPLGELIPDVTYVVNHKGSVRLAETAARFIDDGLTGWDLAGPEEAFPDPLDHARAFAVAREAGLRVTIHAGEWGGAGQVQRALTVEPERIAHGPGAVDDAALCGELVARGISLDLCPTSNWQAGIVPSIAEHPLATLHRRGVPVTLNTDDTTVSDLTLTEEYTNAVERIGLTLPELWAIDRRALDVAFADEDTLVPLRAEFDAWAAGIPELAAADQA